MPFYYKQGNIPPKRHTAFRNESGGLYYEELVSREGFSGIYSNLYHLNRPTKISKVGNSTSIKLERAETKHRARHITTSDLKGSGDAVSSRIPLFFNVDVTISTALVTEPMKYCYRNGVADELFYVQAGKGEFQSNLGTLQIEPGDYVVIPRGILWQLNPAEKIKLLITESTGSIETPNRYRNKFGQLLEHSPFCERDIHTPELQQPHENSGETRVLVKTVQGLQEYFYAHHPCDVIGWDGYYFPWKISIHDFEPIVGSIHQPPPVHQTFQAQGFVVCSFVPRLFDFHPDAIPAPYPHFNVDSDEIIYYSRGNFMSRQGIQEESITLHPMGLPHGPQPGKYSKSIGKKYTDELAVMIDTFKPLHVTETAKNIDDSTYPLSWVEK
ncbi:MAG: homogentisate 1,2-dioxygenase [Candidatus Marinimicrobia bacterium]|jgi:homogentisate 1,2-dioxygenase|nr:homogentisate 1,2-dioxygenase [Candidatus Neomarinimicrobiota bacterium]